MSKAAFAGPHTLPEVLDLISPITLHVFCSVYVPAEELYTLQDKSDLASQTLAKREGMCTNKANLQVALLRAAGIPGMPHRVRTPD